MARTSARMRVEDADAVAIVDGGVGIDGNVVD